MHYVNPKDSVCKMISGKTDTVCEKAQSFLS